MTACRGSLGIFMGAVLALVGLAPQRALADTDENGFILDWVVFGPLAQAPGCCPDDVTGRLDYLSDGGSLTESTIKPKAGDELFPDFQPPVGSGAAASLDYHTVLLGEFPAWTEINAADVAGDGSRTNVNPDTLDFNLIYEPTFDSANQGCPAPVENAVAFAVAYVNNPTDNDQRAMLELASDDSIQVKLDDCELAYLSIGRGFGGPGTIQNRIPVVIPPGGHRLFVKVFNGCGGFGFRLRFTDRTTGAPLSLGYSTDPAAFSVPDIEPESVALALTHTASPDRVLGLDTPVTVTITATKVDPSISDAVEVTVTETLIAGTSLLTATPPVTSQDGQLLTWKTTVGDLVTTGITYDFKFSSAACGTDATQGCVSGEFKVAGSACTSLVTGTACTAAVPLNAIFLGSIIGGGDGTGPKADGISGTRIDMDSFLSDLQLPGENNDSTDVDDPNTEDDESLLPFQPITDVAAVHPDVPEVDLSEAAELIDGTFFMNTTTVAINSAGVEFTFSDVDPNPGSWNHILSNITHDIDKGVGNIRVAGQQPFATGMGIHASAGVTFDLNAIRAKFGAQKVKFLSTLLGVDGCGLGDPNCGEVNLYIIYSTEDAVLDEFTYMKPWDTDTGEQYSAPIPTEAAFLTFATGAAGNGICCDHGVFAEARIFPDLPVPSFTATPETGPAPLAVNFNASGSTAPAGEVISCYLWDFGDGSTGSGATVSHTFADRGDFVVKLTVQTDKGLTNSTTKTISATFACGDVSPFVSSDIGSPSQAGCGHKEGDCIVVLGGGMDITGASDQFQLVHKSKTGDVSLSANITEASFEPPVRGRTGVMMRDGTAADAAFAAMEVIPSGGNLKAFFQSRATTGAAVVNKTTPNVSLVRGAAYLKIERAGNDFIGSTSADGTTYTEFARVTLTAPPASMLAGLMVCARDTTGDGTAAEVTFCNIKYSDEASNLENCTNGTDDDGDQAIDCADSDCASAPSCQGGGTFHRGDADSNGQLQLTDAIRILGVLFLGQGSISCTDAADADDNGSLQLTDAIRILGVLFLGQGVIPAPGPTSEPCGGDPTADALDCADYPAANCQ